MPFNRASCPCPQCNALITSVLRTYRSEGGDYLRYRECEFCGHRYKTIQFAEFLAEPDDASDLSGGPFTLHLKLNVDSLRSRNPQRRNGRRLRSSIDQPRQP
jgi:Zn ribbon nucleic-acid-binding protein